MSHMIFLLLFEVDTSVLYPYADTIIYFKATFD